MEFCSMHVADITIDKDQYWSYAAYLYVVPTLHTFGRRVNKVKYCLKNIGPKIKKIPILVKKVMEVKKNTDSRE